MPSKVAKPRISKKTGSPSPKATKGFPTQRKNEPNNFVASVVSENHTLWEICPEECRPKDHLDWTHC